MRFGPLFARGETLATRRNATDGTPPSGVVKINSHQYTKALWQRMVAVLVAVSMATSLTPSAAFANENAESATADEPVLSASSDAVSGDADAGDSQVGTNHASDEQGAGAAGADGVAGDAGDASTVSDALVDEVPSGDSSNSEEANSEAPVSVASVASEQGEPKAVAASAATLSSEAKVFIQDTKDKDNSYSTKSGALKAGETLWANMYDEVEDDWYGTLTESVANPGTWAYTWLAGTTRASSNVVDYTEVVGHEQSLNVTAAMEGKYFICKVTADGKDYYGPAAYDSGINVKDIPGPVLGAGQMELSSVKLSSDTPSIGDTLTATPYISYYQQAPADAKVTYTWSASASQSLGFTKIEGQTGASLVVGDDLEGKYIKVEATAGVNTVNKTTSSKVKQAGAVEISAVSIVNTKDNTSVFAVGDTAKARAKETGGAYGAFVDASKLNYQWQCSDTKSGAYTDIAGATGETLELTDALGGKYLKCKVSSKIGSSSKVNSTGALVAAAGSIHVTSVTMSPTSGKVEVGSTITATATAGSTDVTNDSHVTWQWYKGTSNTASSCNTPIEGETGNTLTVTAALKGYYVVAKANGGYGEQKPYYAAGPVSVAGQVELYDVQFEGSPATNGVHVGDTLKTKVRKKDGSKYSYIDRTDNATYQWQYANTSSSDDPAYTDIPGATEATYTVDAAYAGKYLRVKVTSENTVSSTQKKSSNGSTQSVAPLGPVTLKGQYKLAGIELADKNVTLSVGSKITPSVQVPGSWSGTTKDVPDDAELTMAWYAKGEGDADWTELTDGIDTTDGSLTISDALVGKRIKVTASALDNTVEWVSPDSVTAAGEYNLLRVTTAPQINSDTTHLVSGDSVKATVQAKRADGSTTNGIDVTDKATVAWYAADDAKASAADWTLLPDMSGAEATVSASAAGKYLKAVATSGSSTVELVSANKVIAAGSLEAAVQKLNDANKQIVVDYSAKGGNVNDVLKAQLADLGFTDIDVKISEGGVAFKAEDDKATVGISDAQDKTNGDVTFFFIDPNDYTGYNIDGLRNADVAFELSRDGKTEHYQPNKSVQVAWDEAKLQDLLDSAAESLQIGYAAGESADGVTQNVTLPYKAGSAKKFSVEWTSSDTERLFVSGYSWEDKTGKVSRASSDRDVTLTAKVTVTSGDIKLAGSHDFKLTVKGDPEKVAADKKALQEKVEAAFTYDNIKYSGTDTVADKDGLTADLQMPRTSTLNIDGKYYKVEYSASTDDITFNGYKGTVYQPLPGTEAAKTKITLTVTDKSNAEVTASKTLDFAIAPQEQDELDAELFHLSLAKSTFSQGILDGQDASNVTGNLHAPLKVYGQGYAVNWCYSPEEAAGHYGFVFSELPGGTENTYRLLKSSKPSVIAHENLILTQPEYNTKVTISGRLKSERFARYAERYPDNSDYAVLAGLDVSATVNVKGTTGLDNPNEGKTIAVTAKVTGVSASDVGGNYTEQSVVPLTELTLPADEDTTAESVLEQLMTAAGCTNLEANAWGLTSATMPDGRVLSTTSVAPYSYWSFFVNNGYASVGAPSYFLKNGDCVEFRYVKGDGMQKPSTAPATNPGTEHPDVDAAWNGFANGGSGSSTDALTPTTKTDTPSWALNLLTEEQQKAGASVSASDPVVANGKVYLVTGASIWGGKTWNAVLNEVDPETGSVVRSLELGSSMDTTCRPVIAQGIILIPLSGGYLQAVSAKTFETLWYSDAFTKQNLSSLTVDGDYVYINTLDYWSANGNDVQNGTVRRINIHTGAIAGSASVADGGYYWSGGLMVNGYYVVGGDYGQVRVYSADLSKLVGSIKLSGGNIRSALTVHDGYIYAVTRDDGTLHKLTIGSDGSITEDSAVQFAPYSTSTPVFSGEYAFICGATANNWTAKGLLSIIDLSDMSVKQITKANGEELGFESKSTPLVSTHDGETYVYFTLNGAKGNWPNYTSGGGVYMYKLGDAEATEVFVPGSGYANYCMASVVCDEFGNLYYTNDSGHLFCVKSQAHRVKFDTQGGSSINDQTPASGSAVAKPADPTREGYTFGGWYTDAACTKAYDFATAVTSDMTLYAKWTKNEASSPDTDNAGGKKDNAGTQSASQGGYVSPSSLPLSQSALSKNDGEKADDGKKDDDQKSVKASDAKSSSKAENDTATKSAAAADDGASSTESAPIWPYIVLAVGVAGLAAAIVWFVVARRKRDGDE